MAFTFAQLAYRVWADLGKIEQYHEFLATGGSATTIVDTKIGLRPEIPEDDYAIDYTAIVVRDAGGLNAVPEGEIQRVTDYVAATSTYTVDTFTSGVGADDTIAMPNSEIPLREMYRICNRALIELGDVDGVDTSLTTAGSQTEYALPEGITRNNLRDVLMQTNTGDSNDNQYLPIEWWKVKPPVTIGSTGILEIRQQAAGNVLQLIYDKTHPDLSAGTSAISKSIHPSLAIAAATAHALQWLNGATGGGDKYWTQRENKAWNDLEIAMIRHPIWRWPRRSFGLQFDPGTYRYPGDQSIYDR